VTAGAHSAWPRSPVRPPWVYHPHQRAGLQSFVTGATEQLPFRSACTGSAARFRVTDLHSTRCQERTMPRFAILEAPSSDETFRKKLGLGLQVERKT
jgi:hypothetical protein